jgi:hypothetical protein
VVSSTWECKVCRNIDGATVPAYEGAAGSDHSVIVENTIRAPNAACAAAHRRRQCAIGVAADDWTLRGASHSLRRRAPREVTRALRDNVHRTAMRDSLQRALGRQAGRHARHARRRLPALRRRR